MTDHNVDEASIILDVLRVIKNGPVVKKIIDETIDRCAPLSFNLRDSIEDARMRAEQATDNTEEKIQINRGML